MPVVLCEEGAARWWRPVSSSSKSSPPGPLLSGKGGVRKGTFSCISVKTKAGARLQRRNPARRQSYRASGAQSEIPNWGLGKSPPPKKWDLE